MVTNANVNVNVVIPVPTDLDNLEFKFTDLEEKIKILNVEKINVRKEILDKMEAQFGHQGYSYVSNLTGNTLQRILCVTQEVDENKLKKLITPEIWNKITTQVVNMDLLLAEVKMGEINPAKIAPAMTDKEVEKLTVRKNKTK